MGALVWPNLTETMLLAAAAWRTWTLIASDEILDPVRDRLLWSVNEDGDVAPRARLITLVECPYCLGFWMAVAWWGAFVATPWTLVFATPWALSTAVIAIEATVQRLTRDDSGE